jgi:hypothetical protein
MIPPESSYWFEWKKATIAKLPEATELQAASRGIG